MLGAQIVSLETIELPQFKQNRSVYLILVAQYLKFDKVDGEYF